MTRRIDRPVLSLFTGAMGLDLGLEAAGFRIAAAVECNAHAAATIRLNRPALPLLEKRLEDVSTEELLDSAGLSAEGEVWAVTGGPSCQSFSTAGHRNSVSDPRGEMFREFLRVVDDVQPRFFVMENVTGVLSSAIRHRPLAQRGPGHPPLEPDEELGSAFGLILEELASTGYHVLFDVLNAADYGVPQKRKRVIFIGSRDGHRLSMPPITHAKSEGDLPTWRTLRDAIGDLDEDGHEFHRLPPSKARFLERVPAGGNWRDLPEQEQREALGGAYDSWGGRTGFFRRLAWDAPAPALTTRPDSKATMFGHPERLRPLSVQEYARIQQFEDPSVGRTWQFAGTVSQKYIQVGNAVPVGLGAAVGRAVIRAARTSANADRLKKVACRDRSLVERLANRPATVLNPDATRPVRGAAEARRWMAEGRSRRRHLLDLIEIVDD